MAQNKLSKSGAEKLIKKSDIGKHWKVRHERVACAANSGDSGWRDIYNNGEKDVLSIEYPHNHSTVLALAL